jgi:hypothetical protein
MSIRTKVFAVTATLLALGGVGTANVGAATPSCGAACIDISSPIYGSASNPSFVLADATQSPNTGQPLTLARAGNTNPGEDFTMNDEGPVSDFVQAGLMANEMGVLYGSLEVFEIEYAPFGAPTGLCVGVPTTPANGTRVELQPCGVSCRTCWIPDPSLGSTPSPMFSGATDSNFSTPESLTVPLLPGLPLSTSALHTGTVPASQHWNSTTGVLP